MKGCPDVRRARCGTKRFRREATLGASLDHPNIVRVYDFDTREGISFLIMTFVRGGHFEERLPATRRSPPTRCCASCARLADALGTPTGAASCTVM